MESDEERALRILHLAEFLDFAAGRGWFLSKDDYDRQMTARLDPIRAMQEYGATIYGHPDAPDWQIAQRLENSPDAYLAAAEELVKRIVLERDDIAAERRKSAEPNLSEMPF